MNYGEYRAVSTIIVPCSVSFSDTACTVDAKLRNSFCYVNEFTRLAGFAVCGEFIFHTVLTGCAGDDG